MNKMNKLVVRCPIFGKMMLNVLSMVYKVKNR